MPRRLRGLAVIFHPPEGTRLGQKRKLSGLVLMRPQGEQALLPSAQTKPASVERKN